MVVGCRLSWSWLVLGVEGAGFWLIVIGLVLGAVVGKVVSKTTITDNLGIAQNQRNHYFDECIPNSVKY